ncbi:hypothetical protein STUTZSP0542_35670 [Stutzerimonas marianensis]
MLTLAKALLALYVEDQRDTGTRALLDLLVRITKRQAEFLGKQASDGALSSAHRTYEDDI